MNLSRLIALIIKETRQMLRDKSNLAVGLALPIVLILLFGYGLSFDIKNANIAIITPEHNPKIAALTAGIIGSTYMHPIYMDSMTEAENLLNNNHINAILRFPVNASTQLASGNLTVQLITNGTDAVTAQTIQNYIQAALAQSNLISIDRYGNHLPHQTAQITINQRMWFNDTNNSTHYLVPGILVLIMTLIGSFLTSLLVAREWERGTLESLFVTPVNPLEITLSKIAPYLLIGIIDLIMCLIATRYLFHVPIRGSLIIIIGSSLLYLIVSLNIGLLISAITKNQFQASQIAMLASFLPAVMLSGFIFDLRNVPHIVQIIGNIIPATYYMELTKTLFLAGDNPTLTLKNCLILTAYALSLTIAVTHKLRKKL